MEGDGSTFNLERIRDFILSRGGKITNHELVKHFKSALTNPSTRDAARNQFKEIVNTIATITRDEEGEKYLVLKKKYRLEGMVPGLDSVLPMDVVSVTGRYDDLEPPPYKPPPPPGSEPLPPLVHHSMESPAGGRRPSRREDYSRSGSLHDLHGRPGSLQSLDGRGSDRRYDPARLGSLHDSPMHSRPGSLHDSPMHSRPGSLHDSPMHSRSGSLQTTPLHSRSGSYQDSPRSPPDDSPYSSRPSSLLLGEGLHRSPSVVSEDSLFVTPPTSPCKQEPPPPVPPRRKSTEKLRDNKENEATFKRPKSLSTDLTDKTEGGLLDDSKISVRERMQKFNRLASESALIEPVRVKKRFDKGNGERDEEDSVSVSSLQLDPKFREWAVKCSQGDYQAIAKMAAENPRLIKLKNAANYTALHWAAKHGNLDLIKLIAGTYGGNVNARTNGGYTALHIAMQYGHEDLYNLLVQVYGADVNIRDWSGKKARQYLMNKDTSVSADTFRKLKARKKQSEKDHGFLRIGSLNVRVKKTTEAFSNFLGVGQTDKLHKNWGSADNITLDEDTKKMPPPKTAPIKKRKSKRPLDFTLNRGNSNQSIDRSTLEQNTQDSDSDTAAGFGTNWLSSV